VFSLAQRSLYVADLDLWIDSMRPRERCYVSHGHSDHAREHDTIVTTPANAAICRSRFERAIARGKQTSLLRERRRPACDFEERGFPLKEASHELAIRQGFSDLDSNRPIQRHLWTSLLELVQRIECLPKWPIC